MIWPEGGDAGNAAADFRALQRKQEEYARELDRQIEARRAAQAQEQQALEELERRRRPSARSPAKWLVDGGRVDYEDSSGVWAGGDAPSRPLTQQVHGTETGEPSTGGNATTAASPFTRFRVTDESLASERLRERAQQLELRRALDEQVRENARLRAAEEEARRRGEREAAENEVRFLRDQQLRAQRKLGYASPSPASRAQDTSMDATTTLRASARRRFQIIDSEQAETPTYPPEPSSYGAGGGGERAALPPAAPTRLYRRSSFASPTDASSDARAAANDNAGASFESAQHSRLDVIEQYRGLLNEIRREREELRREREEARREKDELRIQRALLELENEKMASLVDAQRRLSEQQMERQQRDAHALAQQQHQQQMGMALGDRGFPPPTPPTRTPTPPRFAEYSRADQLRQSLAALAMADPVQPPTPRRRASPMSMAEFTTPRRRQASFVADSPVYEQRPAAATPHERSQAAWVDESAEPETPLDQSLVGESVFVPLEPTTPHIAATASPRAQRASPRSSLRSSRVIRSRGFYDIESTYEEPSRPQTGRSQRRAASLEGREEHKFGSDEPSRDSDEGDVEDEDYGEEEDDLSFNVGPELERFHFDDDGSWASISELEGDGQRGLGAGAGDRRGQGVGGDARARNREEDGRSPTASGLFQVQVLV